MSYQYIPTIVCSDFCTYLINNERSVLTMGENNLGKLGHDTLNDNSITVFPPKIVSNLVDIKMINTGNNFAVCCDYSGKLFTFGSNYKGKLGRGLTLESSFYPQQVELPPIDYVVCGMDFVVCLSFDNILYSFGDNAYGQLAVDNIPCSTKPLEISNLCDIEFVECGGYHVICKNIDNIFYAWGKSSEGQLPTIKNYYTNTPTIFKPPSTIRSVKCGTSHSLLLTIEGIVYSCGGNSYGQLGYIKSSKNDISEIPNIPEIQRIECGCHHTMCIDINHNLWVCGWNIYGQLGLGVKQAFVKKPTLFPIKDIYDISSSGYHTMVKTSDNKIYSTGDNSKSQLGKKTNEKDIQSPIQVFEDNEDIWASSIIKSRAKSARK